MKERDIIKNACFIINPAENQKGAMFGSYGCPKETGFINGNSCGSNCPGGCRSNCWNKEVTIIPKLDSKRINRKREEAWK